tara:strand:- start:111 stop:521 length:411 start_codon:yes stop_codon:yes gene_type:complete
MKIHRTQHKKTGEDVEEAYHAEYEKGEKGILDGIGYSKIMQADNTPFESLIIETVNGIAHIKKSKPYELKGVKKFLNKYAPKLAGKVGIKEDLGFEVHPNPESAKKIYQALNNLEKKAMSELPEHITKMLKLFFLI